MKFRYNGVSYLIEFERQQRERPAHVQPKGKKAPKLTSTATTARVFKLTGYGPKDRSLVREYTVAQHYKDQYDPDHARVAALTLALFDAPLVNEYKGVKGDKGKAPAMKNSLLSKEFRRAAWNAYHKRSEATRSRVIKAVKGK